MSHDPRRDHRRPDPRFYTRGPFAVVVCAFAFSGTVACEQFVPNDGAVGTGGTQSSGQAGNSSGGTSPSSSEGGTNGTSNGGNGQSTGQGGASSSNGGAAGHPTTGGAGGAVVNPGTGGRVATGGMTGTGGRAATGGAPGTGGVATGGAPATGGNQGTSGNTQPPPLNGGSNGWASRFWDCCKPACGWSGNVKSGKAMASCDRQDQSLGGNYDVANSCDMGGQSGAYMCWSGAPWSVSDSLSYGFAAATGSNYVCGRCFQVQFTGSGHSGNNAGATALNGKTMIVQIVNTGGVASDQFDLLIPGGGVGANNACSAQWNTTDLGSQYGGFLAGCNGDTNCVRQKCQSVFAGKPDLQAGCDWFLGWFSAADNPNFVYKQIACPAAITQRSGLPDPG